MLEKLPVAVGRALRGVRPGLDELVYDDAGLAGVPECLEVESGAFAPEGAIPRVYTADGEGTSPPLAWRGVPEAARALVLLVEDADSPTPQPLVHSRGGSAEPGAAVAQMHGWRARVAGARLQVAQGRERARARGCGSPGG